MNKEEIKHLCQSYYDIHKKYDKLQQENKQLKIQISAREEVYNRLESNWNKLNKKYENAVADYEKTMFEKEQLNSLVNSCQEEIRQLKKQLEDYKKLGFKHLQDKNNNLETQQKEFIKYLEDESKEIYRDGGLRQYIFRQILRKYRSITGVSDENNIK